ncbi:sensor histidine kinase [Paenibacillus sp. 1P07SE]|uniref:sensor histidine kinase n=1 Tax=Paenibacillus sp. 1P07SE TaxID=3132209 RepID=UPI0039A61EE3
MDPIVFVRIWRFLQIGMLTHLWIVGDSESVSFLLILLLLVMVCLRVRFKLSLWAVLGDILICLLFLPATPLAAYAFALPMLELILAGRWPVALLLLAALPLSQGSAALGLWYYGVTFFVAVFSRTMLGERQRYQQEADEQRQGRLELERVKSELLTASRSVAQQAELMERYRIARQLHDHLGHDLTGATLALQAYDYVKEPEEADKLLSEVKRRLERSTASLRETVHNATPVTRIGIERLEAVVQEYGGLEMSFSKTGDMQRMQAHHWELLEACLKESLTNVARHSNASYVRIEVQSGEKIARLLVQDNGTAASSGPAGSGLKSLQLRARAYGGSLSVSRDNGFMLVCVIPIEGEVSGDEAADRR